MKYTRLCKLSWKYTNREHYYLRTFVFTYCTYALNKPQGLLGKVLKLFELSKA